jgi:hypothetical protein
VGKLIFASLERPDLSFVVKELSSYLASPTKISWLLLELGAKYLIGRESALIHMKVELQGGEPRPGLGGKH